MSDDMPKKMTDPVGRMTARDALVYVAGVEHWHCTVVSKMPERDKISFRCACGVTYMVANNEVFKGALRNVPTVAKS